VKLLILVNAMIPEPGETAGEWWDHVGWQAAAQAAAERDRRPAVDVNDLDTLFFHDMPPEILDVALRSLRSHRGTDRLRRAVATRRVARGAHGGSLQSRRPALPLAVPATYLGLGVHELPGGHLLALGHSHVLADQLIASGQPNQDEH
jgi:hypothetical protein